MGFEFRDRDDGVIWVCFKGDIEEADAIESFHMYERVVARTPEDGTILFLVDASRVGKAPARPRKAFLELFRNVERRRVRTALFGANRYVVLIADFVLRALGNDRVRLFGSEQDAVAWLKAGQ